MRTFLEGLQEVDSILSLHEAFILIPVEIPSVAVAKAMVDWLAHRRYRTRVVQPRRQEDWRSLVADLVGPDTASNEPSGDVVVLIGTERITREVRAGLRLLNQRRDTIAKTLRALLWCGPSAFHVATAELAPDFWSIRDLPLRLGAAPPESSPSPAEEARAARGEPDSTLTTSVASPEELRSFLDAARRMSDRPNEARLSLRLARALLGQGSVAEAEPLARSALAFFQGLAPGRDGGYLAQAHAVVAEIARRLDQPRNAEEHAARSRPLRFLHMSDIHLRAGDTYAQDVVLDALVRSFAEGGELCERRPDIIFCTGDLAHSGKPAEYTQVARFFEALLRATEVPRERLFVVPGNHDLDRAQVSKRLQLVLSSRDEVDDFFGPADPAGREFAFRRFLGFADFQRDHLSLLLDAGRPYLVARCRVGDRVIEVLGLNTAWLAHEDAVQGKLVMGERLVREALDGLDAGKSEVSALRVALFHHPLDWLCDFERDAIKGLLLERCDFLLHGHLHSQRPEVVVGPEGSAVILAAGAAYQGRAWPNLALLVEVDDREARVEAIAFRERGRGVWVRDPILAPKSDGVFRMPRRGEPLPAGPLKQARAASQADLEVYLRQLENSTRWAELPGISGTRDALPVRLDHLFVPLRIHVGGGHHEPEDDRRFEAFRSHPFLLLLGDPGSGKTTLLRYLAHHAARALAGDTAARAGLGLADGDAVPLPMLIPLRHVAAFLPEDRDPVPGDLEDALVRWVERDWRALPEDLLRERLRARGVWLLFDGLDEIPDAAHRSRTLRAIQQAAERLEALKGPGGVVVTSRPAAYGDPDRLRPPFVEARLLDLEPAQVMTFLERWIRAAYAIGSSERLEAHPDAERELRGLRDAVRSSPALDALSRKPVLLTALALVHHHRGRLPEQRVVLYDEAVNVLLRRFQEHRTWKPAVVRGHLAAVAWHLMEASGPEKLREEEHLEVLTELVARRHAGLSPDTPAGEIPREAVREAGRLLEEQDLLAGILRIGEDRRCRFVHRTFQEYLAAWHLADGPESEVHAIVVKRLLVASWRETLRLLAGLLASRGPGAISRLLTKLIGSADQPPGIRIWGIAGATSLLAEVEQFDLGPAALEPIRSQRDWLLRTLDDDSSSSEWLRMEIGRALGYVGDPRLTPDRRWVEVPGGPVWGGPAQGDPGARDDDSSDCWIDVPGFRVQRWPVTVKEYTQFVEDGSGYATQEVWDKHGWQWRTRHRVNAPDNWQTQLRSPSNVPVVGVCWWEADAYCRWLTTTMTSLPEGTTVRLPTEAEWVKAARGGRELSAGRPNPEPRRPYPRGMKWKTEEDSLVLQFDGPNPVGCDPSSIGPYGTWDQAGNVWEWCLDWVEEGSRTEESRGAEERAVRGGCWESNAMEAHLSYCRRLKPSQRDRTIGFRCVIARPIPAPVKARPGRRR